ncbi:DUF4099 domain-containing protein [Mucilaginibacter limnophilus]|uniref:DUF4099 domain-containing protein n=1 Tax=Mucilaginibacter limnophilus TaxID=1932778 RepID=A0A437MPZ5_9SPHI|nr:DUF4099 domain-containing protein [Mucilaginibacter limnophilus]RVT99711.1 DUF4099 domain-containing protein [Mucilaginibacter limnophilus]
MTTQLYEQHELPLADIARLGLSNNKGINLQETDLQALLAGRRTGIIRLENLQAEGVHIPALDAKLSVQPASDGSLELRIHPIYKEAPYPEYLTDVEAEKLQRGDTVNISKTIFRDNSPLDILVEFDRETNEFIITDTDKIIIPETVNNQPLTYEQKEHYRKGKEVQLNDETTIQFTGTDRQGVRSNKLALVASIIVDGGVSFMLYKGLEALFNKPGHNKEEAKEHQKTYGQQLAR